MLKNNILTNIKIEYIYPHTGFAFARRRPELDALVGGICMEYMSLWWDIVPLSARASPAGM